MDNDALVDRLVSSVLYEGYLLYPYRPSLKNAKRWTFGALYPEESHEARSHSERSTIRARVLVAGSGETRVDAEVRFLQPIERRSVADGAEAPAWHEAEERRIAIDSCTLRAMLEKPHRRSIEYAARLWEMDDLVRHQGAISAAVELTAQAIAENACLLGVTITNHTPRGDSEPTADAALHVLASTHVILRVAGGALVSRIDPPPQFRELCPIDPSDGLWPVLIGPPGRHDTMLCSPIILYDYPEVAAESPGDFFDATEIDEMLALRILTLSADEKQDMAACDWRARALLERTTAMSSRQLAELHGATRGLRAIEEPTLGN